MSSKRDDIMTAAARLFWEQGYESTSPRLIQKAAGAGQGSFYHHFESKADLAAAVLNDVATEMKAEARQHLTGGGSPIERVRRYLGAPRAPLAGCRMGRFANELSIRDPKLSQPIASYFSTLTDLLQAALDEAVDANELPDSLSTQELAATFVAVIQGGFILARATQDEAGMYRAQRGALAMLRALERRDQGKPGDVTRGPTRPTSHKEGDPLSR